MNLERLEINHDESCYFSALDDLQQIDNSLEENYYTHLRFDNDMSSKHYTSLNIRDVPDFTNDSTANDSIISGLLQSDEFSLDSDQSDPYVYSPNFKFNSKKHLKDNDEGFNDEYSNFLDQMRHDLIKRFEKKIRNNKIKHFNLDQTIEECLDEVEYENVLDDLIKTVARSKLRRTRSNLSSTPVSSYEQNKRTDYCCASCKKKNNIQQNRLYNRPISRDKNESESKKNFESNNLIQNTLDEYPMLKHVLDMVKCVNLNDFYKLIKDYTFKITRLISNGSEVVKSVGNVFMSLLSMDLKGLVVNFIAIPLRDKWNVLKNLIYYSVKMTLLSISQLVVNDSGDSFANILNSIYSYVKNFERIQF